MTPEQLAEQIPVDPKTVRRWLNAGQEPYVRHRARIAELLGTDIATLWPNPTKQDSDNTGLADEIVSVLAAGDDGTVDWRELAATAERRIDLLGLTLAGVITEGDPALLAQAAARGCLVRVLLSDRDSVHLAIAEQELNPETKLTHRPAMTADLDRVTTLLRAAAERREVELRTFAAAGHYQVLIFDEQALVTSRIEGVPADRAPVMHVARRGPSGLYDSFSRHFETLWRTGEPIR